MQKNHVDQHPYETLDSAISRALHRTNSWDVVTLRANLDGVLVEVGVLPGETAENVKETLQDAVTRARATSERRKGENMSDETPDTPEGVPLDGEKLPWSQLHPVLREVVLGALRAEREKQSLQLAYDNAAQIALAASMAEMLDGSSDERVQVMRASMIAGAKQSIEGTIAGKRAVYEAFNVAIETLEKA